MKLKFGSWSVTPYLIAIALVGLQACGGGGGSAPPPPTDQNASGIYTGTGTVDSVSTADFKGIIYNNRFMIFSVSQNVVYDGTITGITLKDMTGTADVYESGVKTQSAISVTATVTTESQIQSFTISGTGKGDAVFDLTYDTSYKTASTGDRIKSTGNGFPAWEGVASNLFSSSENAISFETDITWQAPNFSFQSWSGSGLDQVICDYEGFISIPDASLNIYDVKENREHNGFNCSALSNAPEYTGMATVLTVTNIDDTMWYVVTNGTHSVVAILNH